MYDNDALDTNIFNFLYLWHSAEIPYSSAGKLGGKLRRV